MSVRIDPTVGRVLHYHEAIDDARLEHIDKTKPLAAIISEVRSDGLLNLMVVAQDGHPVGRMRVRLFQDGEEIVQPELGYAVWMPYQKGQAAKTEEVEKQAAKSIGYVAQKLRLRIPEMNVTTDYVTDNVICTDGEIGFVITRTFIDDHPLVAVYAQADAAWGKLKSLTPEQRTVVIEESVKLAEATMQGVAALTSGGRRTAFDPLK